MAGWDGGISGVAGCCPELLVAIVRSFRDGRVDDAARLQVLLDELIARLSVFPTPWGIRIALEARGLPTGPLPSATDSSPAGTNRILSRRWFTEWIISAATQIDSR